MWEYMSNFGWGGGMWLGMLLFWGLLIIGLLVLVKCTIGLGACGKKDAEKSALDILKERYARGEIEREEFEQKKNDFKV